MILNHEESATINLPVYQNARKRKQEYGTFEVLRDIDTVEQHCTENSHIWFVSIHGDARQAKVNGKVRRWKRSPERIEVPVKYGMYEYGTFDASDVANGRILHRIA